MKRSTRLGDPGAPARAGNGLADALQARRRTPIATAGTAPKPAPTAATATPQAARPAPATRPAPIVIGGPRPELDAIDDLRVVVRNAVVADFGPSLADADLDESRIRSAVSKQLDRALRTSSISVAPAERDDFIDSTVADMLGWGALTPLMQDPTVTEVMCNGPDAIFVERAGQLTKSTVRFSSEAALRQVADRMLAVAGRRVDEASPMGDGRLADGSRINVIIPPLSTGGTVLTVRRFPDRSLTIADLIKAESLSSDAATFFDAAVRGRLNILVSGGTSTGKTTFLNVLSSYIPAHERIITIEDAAELQLEQPHVVGLESRPSNAEGAGLVTIRDLVRNALRMRPDRIVVGEVRGGEAIDMLQAMNTGHEGSLTTIHANTARDAVLRLETMVLMSGVELPLAAVREQIASAIDLVVQLGRRADGLRVVTGISEVQGREGDTITMQEIFTRQHTGALRATGLRPRCAERLAQRSIELPTTIFRVTSSPHAATSVARRGSRR